MSAIGSSGAGSPVHSHAAESTLRTPTKSMAADRRARTARRALLASLDHDLTRDRTRDRTRDQTHAGSGDASRGTLVIQGVDLAIPVPAGAPRPEPAHVDIALDVACIFAVHREPSLAFQMTILMSGRVGSFAFARPADATHLVMRTRTCEALFVLRETADGPASPTRARLFSAGATDRFFLRAIQRGASRWAFVPGSEDAVARPVDAIGDLRVGLELYFHGRA